MKTYEIWVRYYDDTQNSLYNHHGLALGNDVNDAVQVYLLHTRARQGAMIPRAAGLSIDIQEVTDQQGEAMANQQPREQQPQQPQQPSTPDDERKQDNAPESESGAEPTNEPTSPE